MEAIKITPEIIGIGVTVLGTFITVLAIILAWMSDRRIQRKIATELATGLKEIMAGQREIMAGQKEIAQIIATGQKELAQMLLNQTKILEKMEAKTYTSG